MATNWRYWEEDGEHDWEDPDAELPDGAYLYLAEFQQQFVDRINELIMLAEPLRRGVGLGTLALVPDAAGADMQDVTRYTTWWSRLRSIIAPSGSSVIVATSTGETLPVLSGAVGTVPVWASVDALATDAGISANTSALLPRQANNDEEEPVFEYRAMQQGDRIGKWVFEDVRRLTSRIRYMIGRLTSITPHSELGIPAVKYKDFDREEEIGESPDYAEYTAAWSAAAWVTASDIGTLQTARIRYEPRRRLGWFSQQYHLRHLWRYHAGVVAQQHQWALYILPRAAGVFRDDEALGLTEDEFKLVSSGVDSGPGYHDEGTYYGSEVALADVPLYDGTHYGFLTNERGWLVMGMEQVYVG